jgi:3-isopropylmalate dehydratase small subunit
MPHIRRFFSRNLTNVSILKVCYLSIENIKQTNNNNNKKVSINNLAKLIMKREREREVTTIRATNTPL